MDVNYNDGNWHGWDGGECPVHPNSVVETVWHDTGAEKAGVSGPRTAGTIWGWSHVVKFRVVKKYREPREWWCVGKHMHDTEADAIEFRADVEASNPGRGHLDKPIIHVREVQP